MGRNHRQAVFGYADTICRLVQDGSVDTFPAQSRILIVRALRERVDALRSEMADWEAVLDGVLRDLAQSDAEEEDDG